jgi:cell wall-associated NlpC family hydrolase
MRNIPDWVAKFTDIPFACGGRSREGCDCWGLFQLVSREQFGIELPTYGGLAWAPGGDDVAVARDAARHAALFTPVAPEDARAGDGLLLRVMGAPMHVGVVVCPQWMLHVERGCNSVIEQYTAMHWKRRVLGIYRYTGAQ